MATEQMAQTFGQLQQLSQQLVNLQQIKVWRCRDSSLKLKWKLSPILAQRKLPRRRTMPVTFRRKRPDWRYKFRVEASRSFRQAAAILDWAGDKHDLPISESDIQQVAAKEN